MPHNNAPVQDRLAGFEFRYGHPNIFPNDGPVHEQCREIAVKAYGQDTPWGEGQVAQYYGGTYEWYKRHTNPAQRFAHSGGQRHGYEVRGSPLLVVAQEKASTNMPQPKVVGFAYFVHSVLGRNGFVRGIRSCVPGKSTLQLEELAVAPGARRRYVATALAYIGFRYGGDFRAASAHTLPDVFKHTGTMLNNWGLVASDENRYWECPFGAGTFPAVERVYFGAPHASGVARCIARSHPGLRRQVQSNLEHPPTPSSLLFAYGASHKTP